MVISKLLKTPFIAFKKSKLNVGVAIVILWFALLLGADVMFGPYAEVATSILYIYFFMYLLMWVTVGTRPSTISVGSEGWVNFLIGMLGTGVILLVGLLIFAPFLSSAALVIIPAQIGIAALGFGALHGFVKAYIEESVFRDALPIKAGLGDIISNVLFAAFHGFILLGATIPTQVSAGKLVDLGAANWQYAIIPLITLFVLGLGWAKIRNVWGIMGSTGSHFAWNLFALGILGKIFTGGIVG